MFKNYGIVLLLVFAFFVLIYDPLLAYFFPEEEEKNAMYHMLAMPYGMFCGLMVLVVDSMIRYCLFRRN